MGAAGLRPLRFHDLRHTFGTRMIAQTDIRRVQEWMDHADIQTTMRYLHFAPRAEDAQLVAAAFALASEVTRGDASLRVTFRGRKVTLRDALAPALLLRRSDVPRICEFRGIIISMYRNEGVHHVAHFHAGYGEYLASITLDGVVLEGALPRPQLRAVQDWAAQRRGELEENWARLRAGARPERIAPLA